MGISFEVLFKENLRLVVVHVQHPDVGDEDWGRNVGCYRPARQAPGERP